MVNRIVELLLYVVSEFLWNMLALLMGIATTVIALRGDPNVGAAAVVLVGFLVVLRSLMNGLALGNDDRDKAQLMRYWCRLTPEQREKWSAEIRRLAGLEQS